MSMTCEEARVLVHALADGELDAGHARAVEAHLSRCAACVSEFAAAQALRQALQSHDLRFSAPASLRSRLAPAPPASPPDASRRAVLKGFAFGGALSAVAASGVGVLLMRAADDSRVLGEALSAHLRSLQPDHLTDVLSSSQHTVRPWFNGRIDLAPPVVDLAAQGFMLIGGRLDYIDGRPVAALVYRRRAHVINVFVGTALGPAPAAPKPHDLQGYNALRWRAGSLDFIAVSDLNSDELREFGNKFVAAVDAAPAPG